MMDEMADFILPAGTVPPSECGSGSEAALRQTQKLESLGMLAGSVAHDFNNLLTAILGNLNLAQASLEAPAEAAALLAKVELTVLRAAGLARQVLAYSGTGPRQRAPQDLNRTAGELMHLMRVAIPENISFRMQLGRNLPAVEGDPAQIHQVIMNLLTNAAEAIGEAQGHILLGTRVVDLGDASPQGFAPVPAMPPGRYVVLDVSDTGCGMSLDVQQHIFDPFFTTKATGKGLGLATMLGILREHRAGIRIRSEEGRGTTFEVFFPAGSEALPPPAPWETEPMTRFNGRILLVDDEEAVLDAIGHALEALGLDVVRARNGTEALRVFEVEGPTLDVVLMDISMPRMDGRKAFRAMRKLQPEIPVILSSGYGRTHCTRGLNGTADFLQKPYRIPELRKALTLAMDRRSALAV